MFLVKGKKGKAHRRDVNMNTKQPRTEEGKRKKKVPLTDGEIERKKMNCYRL